MPNVNSIRSSPTLLLTMLDSIAEGIFFIDPDGKCTYCNSRCIELLRFSDELELLDQNMHELIHHHHRDGSEYKTKDCKILEVYKNDRQIEVNNEVFWRRDNTAFDVEYRSYPIKDGSEIIGAVVSFFDTTIRREEGSYLSRLARLVETSYDAIISKSLDGVITSWNKGAKEIYGYDAEEVIGQSVSVILPIGQDQEEAEILSAVQNREELTQFEVKRRHKSGAIRDISLTVSPIINTSGELIGLSSIERDFTERRRYQDEILAAKSEAERALRLAESANRVRAEFLANVSHELRTPMNAILGMLQLTLEEPLDSTIEDYLKTAKSSADSLLHLVNEILDFSKIESGKFEVLSGCFDVRDVVDSSAKSLSTRANEKGLEIFCEIDSEIPTSLIGDGRRIQQVITNLLGNAVKFTESGEVVVSVAIAKKTVNEIRLKFSVKDTGVGIAAEDRERIFSPFAQADMSSTRQYHGTGLGLTICRELVTLMGGELQLQSAIGKGSTFSFELSLPVDDATKPFEQFPTALVDKLKVLVVDDNATNLRILEKILVSWSMQPIVAESGQQALRILDETKSHDHAISLAVVDGLMPGMDGFELANRIAAENGEGNPPVVIMQAASDLSVLSEQKRNAPVADYLTKPVSQSELLNTVIETLNLYESTASQVISTSNDTPIRPLNVLLVEDLPANQKVAQAILEKRGHKISIAPNGRVAVDMVQTETEKFDVILMDVQMPVMDGLQATAAIRSLDDQNLATIPIVAMTARALQGDRESCLSIGMDSYISKPLDANRLVELTEAIVHSADFKEQIELVSEGSADGSVKPYGTNHDSQNDASLVEMDVALRRLGGDKELFLELVTIFMEDSPPLFDGIVSAIDQNQARSLEKMAHALKGLMSNFGARKCVELAKQIEKSGHDNDLSVAKTRLSEFKQLYDRLCDELSKF